ncbi:Mitochondrial transcription termination factor family [Olea europaea subsp. europaea]|uniref:Mitochondrial transcription termination factor family n=1 Tax=Olea europaea subsp. europaea TaxID=158383 RepID=A0A8S0S929_OLEEU|nr:Mitochondrial transcription termination factor family [Olea europaea subsp. europaea]
MLFLLQKKCILIAHEGQMLFFLAEHGFSKSQISELVLKRPEVLLSNPEKTLLPKIEFFLQSTGVAKADLLKTIARDPTFLTRSVENQLMPICSYLKDIVGAEKVDSLLRRGSWIFYRAIGKKLILNVNYLLALGVPNSFIATLLSSFPQALAQNHDQFRKKRGRGEGNGI